MLSTLRVQHPWFSPAILALLVIVGPVAERWLYGRPRIAWTLFGISLVPIVLLSLVPSSREIVERCTVAWALPTFGRVELMANVILFVPPVLLAAIASRRPLVAFFGGVVGSAAGELVQALLPALGRSCDTNDWLTNSIGAAIGAPPGRRRDLGRTTDGQSRDQNQRTTSRYTSDPSRTGRPDVRTSMADCDRFPPWMHSRRSRP